MPSTYPLAPGRLRAHIPVMDESSRPPAERDDPGSQPLAVGNSERERAVERLRAHYVRDDIDVDTYERLLDVAWAAESRAELDRLMSRLPALPESEPPAAGSGLTARRTASLASPAEQKEHGFQFSLMSGSERKGSWVPPKTLHTLALMGGAGLDFLSLIHI